MKNKTGGIVLIIAAVTAVVLSEGRHKGRQ